jgi:hypothetical protein
MNQLAADKTVSCMTSKQARQCLPPRLMEYVVQEDVGEIEAYVDQVAAPSSLFHLPML